MSTYLYDAFISYRHIEHDKSIAIKLQRLLESYRPPKSINYSNTNKIKRIFRDESELPTSGDLGADIKRALEQSAYLILVCSEETSKSKWCMDEIDYFKQLHNGNCENILTLLVSGDPKEVFPKSLCYETRPVALENGEVVKQTVEIEPLAANVVSKSTKAAKKKLSTEFLRIAAPILGCKFDDLYKRHQRRFMRNFVAAASVIIALILSFSVYAVANAQMLEAQAKQILEKQKELEITNNELNQNRQKLEETNIQLENKNTELQKQIEETTKQKNIANKQTKIAEMNEQKAIQNLNFANEQKALAVKNADEAKRQEQIAVDNQKKAEENFRIATEEKNKVLRSQSLFLSSLSNQQVAKGDNMTAIMLALEGMPKDLDNPERPFMKSTEDALRNAIYASEPTLNSDTPKGFIYQSILNHNGVMDTYEGIDSSRIYTFSSDVIRLWDTRNGKLIDEKKIDSQEDSNTNAFYNSKNYLLLEQNYYNSENAYDSGTKVVSIIKKNKDKIIITKSFETKSALISELKQKALLISKEDMPIYVDLNNGSINELKDLKKTLLKYNIKKYSLIGDISADGKELALFDNDNNKINIFSKEDGTILQSIDAKSVSEINFLSDNSIMYSSTIDYNENIFKYHNGKSDLITIIAESRQYQMVNNTDKLLWVDNKGVEGKCRLNVINLLTNKISSVDIENNYVWTITISPDGKYAALSENGTAFSYIVDLGNLKNVNKVGEKGDELTFCANVAFSPDSKFFIYYSPTDPTPVKMYETSSMTCIGTLTKIEGEKSYISKFLSDNKLVIRYDKNSIYIVDIDKPAQVNYFYGEAWSKAYFNDNAGTSINTNEMSGKYKTYDVITGKQLSELNYKVNAEKSFIRSNLGESVIMAIDDKVGIVPVFTMKNKSQIIDWEYGEILGSNISLDGNRFLIRSKDDIVIYNAQTFEKTRVPNLHEDTVIGAIFSPDNSSVITFSRKKIIFSDIETGKVLKKVDLSHRLIECIKQSSDGRCIIAYSTSNNIISVYNGNTGELIYTKTFDNHIQDAAVSGNNSKVLIVSNGIMYLYSLDSGDKLLQLPYYTVSDDFINNIDINYDGSKVLVTYAHSGLVFEWDLITDVKKLKILGEELINGRTFTEDERKIYFIEN